MKLIVGLGNPGKQYEKTRHNMGFMVADQFVKDFPESKNTRWNFSEKFKSDILELEWQPRHGSLEKIILAKPRTYMNNSGMAVRLITNYHKILTNDIWIVHDDVDLPIGSMKIRLGGGTAGHHGVESVLKHLDSDKFWRFRIGTGLVKSQITNHKSQDKGVDEYVLGKFSRHEAGKVKELVHRGSEAIQMALEEGLERAMNRYNAS